VILKTSDAGVNWTVQMNSIQEDIRSISFPDRINGFATGTSIGLFKTTDGGTTWTRHSIPTRNMIYAVCFKDTSNGFVAGGQGTLLATTNGGSLFVPADPATDITARAFPNPGKNQLTVELPANSRRFELYDQAGRLVQSTSADRNTITVNTSELAPGIYLYLVRDEDGNMLARGKWIRE
jgi:photosystem II stability/assembly factor-like uncharacterized protein